LGDWLRRARRLDDRWIAIGQVPFTGKRPLVRDILMAGDSAGLIAPLAGDGIAMALRGGQLAASGCAAFLAGRLSPAGLRRAYGAGWRREFGPRLRLAGLLQAVMLRPAWLARALRLIQHFPSLGTFLVQHTREVRHTP
jgi:flavin-dependent dehydrogenase